MYNTRSRYDNWHKKSSAGKITRYERKFHNRVLDILEVRKGTAILDLGCGKGSFCSSAFERGLNVYGVDFSSVAIEEAVRKSSEINFVLAEASTLPFSDRFFDYVVCLGSLEHFRDKVSGLREVCRVLKDDGKIFMFLPNSYFLGHIYLVYKTGLPIDEAGQDFSESFNTRVGWHRFLEENSLAVLSVYKFNTIWASKKVSVLSKYLYNFILKPFIPFNLSYAFGYLCVKNGPKTNS